MGFCVEAGLCFSCLPWQGECVQRRSNSYLSVLCDQRVLVMARLLARGAGSSFSFFLGGGGVFFLSVSYCWAWRALVRTGVISGDAFWCFGIWSLHLSPVVLGRLVLVLSPAAGGQLVRLSEADTPAAGWTTRAVGVGPPTLATAGRPRGRGAGTPTVGLVRPFCCSWSEGAVSASCLVCELSAAAALVISGPVVLSPCMGSMIIFMGKWSLAIYYLIRAIDLHDLWLSPTCRWDANMRWVVRPHLIFPVSSGFGGRFLTPRLSHNRKCRYIIDGIFQYRGGYHP